MKKTIYCNPEFGCEIACVVPYVHWLYQRDKLEKVYTVQDMRPFYYFLPDEMVIEYFNERTLDNSVSLKDVPNQWIHHNAKAITGRDYSELTSDERRKVNGVLDYREWSPPDYTSYYSNNNLSKIDKPFIVILNKYTLEHGNLPMGYLDMIMLQNAIEYLTDKGYAIVYRRPNNTDYIQDQNEINSVHADLINRYGIKAYDQDNNLIDDKTLVSSYDNCYLLEDLYDKSNIHSKNEFELSLYSNASGFLTVNGGNCVLASIFGKPTVVYACEGNELRDNYFNENCYFIKFANSPIYPIIDPSDNIKQSGTRKYDDVSNVLKKVFK